LAYGPGQKFPLSLKALGNLARASLEPFNIIRW
jgi:hypothetical protein